MYSVDTGYGLLAWKLRKDARVVLLERTNAMHVELPEPVDLVTMDVGWTPQSMVLPRVAGLLARGGMVLTLVKPHYEAERRLLVRGVLPDEAFDGVVRDVLRRIAALGWRILDTMESPLRGHGGNREMFAMLATSAPPPPRASGGDQNEPIPTPL